MKRILFFSIAMTLCGTANAVTKCIDRETLDYGSRTAGTGVSDATYWNVTFDNKITVEGDAFCLNVPCTTEEADGSNGCLTESIDMSTYIWPSGADESTYYCWCRIYRPFVSKWFYLGVIGGMNDEYDGSMCNSDCSSECYNAFIDDQYFLRSALDSHINTTSSTNCPDGYISTEESDITVATTCPSGTVSAGTAESCAISNPNGSCLLYAPAGMQLDDNVGTYEFTDACPLTE